MLINEVCKRCGLTKKAIEYYEEQGLTRPQIMENGYRVFSEDDVIQLNKIAVLRGLGISVSDIKTVLAENDYLSFQTICDKKELEISDIQAKQQLLHMLARNQNWEDARAQLSQLETKRSILSRLLDRFPGYFGKFISLHFALCALTCHWHETFALQKSLCCCYSDNKNRRCRFFARLRRAYSAQRCNCAIIQAECLSVKERGSVV